MRCEILSHPVLSYLLYGWPHPNKVQIPAEFEPVNLSSLLLSFLIFIYLVIGDG